VLSKDQELKGKIEESIKGEKEHEGLQRLAEASLAQENA